LGTRNEPVRIDANNDNEKFGSFVIRGDKKTEIKLNNLIITNGSETYRFGSYFSGSLSIYNFKNLYIKDLSIHNSGGEDALNIKNGKKCKFYNLRIYNSYSDAIDIDNCNAKIENSKFIQNHGNLKSIGGSDGLDFYHSIANLNNIESCGFNDKGVSVGEKSKISIADSMICNNLIGIAIKDSSCVEIKDNNFFNQNNQDISIYQKKSIYDSGELIITKNYKNLNIFYDKKSKINYNLEKTC
jgi:hypothetical protein